MKSTTNTTELTPANDGDRKENALPQQPGKTKRKMPTSPNVSPQTRPASTRAPLLKRRLLSAFNRQQQQHQQQQHQQRKQHLQQQETDAEDEDDDEDDEVFVEKKLTVVLSSSSDDDEAIPCGQQHRQQQQQQQQSKVLPKTTGGACKDQQSPPDAKKTFTPRSPSPNQWQEIPSAWELSWQPDPAPAPPSIKVENRADSLALVPKPKVGFRLGGSEGSTYLYLSKFRGVNIAYLQEFKQEEEENGLLIPTMNGVRKVKLTAQQMAGLEYFLPIFRAVMYAGGPQDSDRINHHVGGKVFASINYSFGSVLDVRENFKPADSTHPIPTKRGVRLSLTAVDDLAFLIEHLKSVWPEYGALSEPCFVGHMRDQGQKSLMACDMCCPDGSEW